MLGTPHTAVDLTKLGVDLRLDGASRFVVPDFSKAHRSPEGIICWDPPSRDGLFGGITRQDAPGSHAGERHLDGDELLVLLTGALRIVLLDGLGNSSYDLSLHENQAFLVPQGVWHRVEPMGDCRYLFMGGGRTEIKQ